MLLSILAALMFFTAAGGEPQTAGSPLGTWSGQDFVVDGTKAFGALTSVTFYENGTYNGILLQMIPIGGQWSMEDGVIITDDATMILEDENTLTIYYGQYEFICSRTDEPEESAELTSAYAADTAVSLLTGTYDRIDGLFSKAIRAMEATRQYISDGQYSSLVHARILCAEVMSLTENSEVPENGFEKLDQQALSDMGIDVKHIQIVTGMCAGAENDVRSGLSVCMDYLFGSQCYKDLGSYIYSFTESFEAYFRAIGREQPLLARMIFEPLWSEPSLASFWSSVPEKWTVIGSDFPEDTAPDSIQNLYMEMAALSGQSYGEAEDSVNSFFTLLQEKEDLIAARKFESIRGDFDMPNAAPTALIPLPDHWLEPSRIRIMPEENRPGADLPAEILLSIQAVEESEYTFFKDYLLPMISSDTHMEGNEKDGWHCKVQVYEYNFSFEWNPETRTVNFRYDPSQMTFIKIGLNNTFLSIITSGGSSE